MAVLRCALGAALLLLAESARTRVGAPSLAVMLGRGGLQGMSEELAEEVTKAAVRGLVELRFPAEPLEAGAPPRTGPRWPSGKREADRVLTADEEAMVVNMRADGAQVAEGLTRREVHLAFLEYMLGTVGAYEQGARDGLALEWTKICDSAWRQHWAVEEPMPTQFQLWYQEMRMTILKNIGSLDRATDEWAVAKRIHVRNVQERCKVEVVPGEEAIALRGDECWVNLLGYYLVALGYPGSLSLDPDTVPVGSADGAKFEALDALLKAYMLQEVDVLLRVKLGSTRMKVGAAHSAEGLLRLALAELLGRGAFGEGTDERLEKVWTRFCKRIYLSYATIVVPQNKINVNNKKKGASSFEMSTKQLGAAHRIRLELLEAVGVRKTVRDVWALSLPLYDLIAHRREDPEWKAAVYWASCYFAHKFDPKKVPAGCSPVRGTTKSFKLAKAKAVEMLRPTKCDGSTIEMELFEGLTGTSILRDVGLV